VIPLTETARAKINLSLQVRGRREDGYHDLRSVVAFADLADKLTMVPATSNRLVVEGPFAEQVPVGEGNIIWKAWAHVDELMDDAPQVSVRLVKNLPVASGMGGGSSDAAAMVRGLLRMLGRNLTLEQAMGLAGIGADVPVCFVGKACVMEGIGDKLSVALDRIPPAIVLVNPGVPCETAAVFAAMNLPKGDVRPLPPGNVWHNDMTAAAIKVQPAIADVLNALKATQLAQVLMSGSGATCFGLADSLAMAEAEAEKLSAAHPGWWVKAARLMR
jgi:4-diphosphocytidyl-2-C-methyl-D-erythritol kinase